MRIPFLNVDLGVRRSTAVTATDGNWSPTDDRWYTSFPFFGKNGSQPVTPESSMGCSAVFSGVKIISETIGTIPLILYRKKSDDKHVRADDNSLYSVLKTLANPTLTAMEFRELMTAHMIFRGNGFAQIVRGFDGQVVGLYPLHPNRMKMKWDAEIKEYYYEYTLRDGSTRRFLNEEIFHLRGPSEDGLWGKSFVSMLQYLIAHNMTLDEYAQNFYTNNAAPSGVLQMAAGLEMTPKAKDNLREEWKKKYSGSSNSGSVAILEEGLTWQQIGMTSQDAQFIDTLKDARKQILGCMRVPPYMVGDTEKLSFNTIEQLSIQFITYTMLPYLVRWEQTVTRDLLRGKERDKLFAEFKVDGLQRGDITSRYSAYSIGRQWGWLSVNDIRRFENQDPIDGGDVYMQPLNMIDSSMASDYLMKSQDNGAKPAGNKDPTDDNSKVTLKNSEIHALLNARAEKHAQIDLDPLFEEIRKIGEKVDKIQEKPEILAENRGKDVKSFKAGISINRPNNITMFSEILGRAMRKEAAAVATATRKEKLSTIETDFYEDHKKLVRESLVSAVRSNLTQISVLALMTRCVVVAGQAVEGTTNEILDNIVQLYNSSYRNAGDKIDPMSHELAGEIAKMIEVETLKQLGIE